MLIDRLPAVQIGIFEDAIYFFSWQTRKCPVACGGR
jgi:hypothetical protein